MIPRGVDFVDSIGNPVDKKFVERHIRANGVLPENITLKTDLSKEEIDNITDPKDGQVQKYTVNGFDYYMTPEQYNSMFVGSYDSSKGLGGSFFGFDNEITRFAKETGTRR